MYAHNGAINLIYQIFIQKENTDAKEILLFRKQSICNVSIVYENKPM